MTAPAEIAPAQAADVAGIRACARAAYAVYVPRIGREPAPMVADFEALVADGRVWVAHGPDGGLQGFVVFYPRDDHMHLENVAVAPAAQGTGVGRSLIAFCEDRARAAGLPAVELYTNAKMTENQQLYPRLGFEEVGRRTEDGFDRVFYRKRL